MKLQLFTVMLVTMLLVHETQSWFVRIRLRRIGRAISRVWKPVCNFGCPRGCGALTGGFGCKFACRHLCGKRKREAIGEGVHVTLLPNNFDFYDLNDDDFVHQWEIAKTLGHKVDEPGLSLAFNKTDTDGDGRLTEEELFTSPVFFFAGDEEAESDVTTPNP